MARRHILLTANAASAVAHFRAPLIRALVGAGHRVTVLAPADGGQARLDALGAGFRPLAMQPSTLNPAADLVLKARLGRAFDSLAPDAVLGFTIKNNVWGAMAASARGIPFIPNVSGLGTAFLSGGALRALAERLCRRAFAPLETVFFQNDEDRDLFLASGLVQPGQAKLLPGSGIDLDAFAPRPPRAADGQTHFLMVARLIRDKGVREYAEAARLLAARHRHARFLLAGPLGVANRGAIPAAEVAGWDAVEWLGPLADVRPAIAAADCVVLPSYREGAPRVLIEAGAMARPAVATDVPGCRQVVADGQTGILCAPRDAAALAEAMDRFLALPGPVRAAMGAAARERIERAYDERLVVAAYESALGLAGAAGAAPGNPSRANT